MTESEKVEPASSGIATAVKAADSKDQQDEPNMAVVIEHLYDIVATSSDDVCPVRCDQLLQLLSQAYPKWAADKTAAMNLITQV